MKAFRYILLAAGIAALASSCIKDPWAEVEKGDWNHERSILSIKFEGQAGGAVIENEDGAAGKVTVTLAADAIEDLSKVKIEAITTSYKSQCSVKSGDSFDFTVAEPTITVTSVAGETRVYSIDMTAFRESIGGVYKIKHLWLWGGTGPVYDCTKLYDLYNKSANFDDSAGRGILAEQDNYLEIVFEEVTPDGNTTGKCYNWAGEDAHNCGFVYAAEKSATGKAIDLSANYRKLPMGVSTWVRDYNFGTLTFTAEDGTQTVCEIVEPQSIELPNTPVITLTLENTAFYFTLSGKDDWDNPWNDYGVIVSNPRRLYIEIEKVEGGVPDSAKTTEEYVAPDPEPDDPEPDEPDEPEPGDFDYTTLKGEYNVYGDNTTFGLWVYGGTADPAFVSPIDKSWDWDDSIWKESDNCLSLNVTEVTATTVRGTVKYSPGEDGEYWNCKWKGDEPDLSIFYGLMPHETTEFVIDVATNMVTFDNGAAAKLLTPGTYKYGVDVYGEDGAKLRTIEEGCIAFDFALSGDGDNSQPWTDIDRFVHGPHNYVMIFEYTGEFQEPSPLEGLSGNYNVYGDNASFGLWVYGGSADPAFISPIEKSWVWDDSIWKESDNGLVVNITGMAGTTVTGTINWWAGDDGEFWDYKMLGQYNKADGTDIDLSGYYGQIPKGETEFTVDASTMTITFSNGNSAKVLLPGTYKYGVDLYGADGAKLRTIEEGCIAFDFALPGVTTPNYDWAWTDYDRLAYGARNYVMVFEKTD